MEEKFSQECNLTLENEVTLPSPLGTDFVSLDNWLFIAPTHFFIETHVKYLTVFVSTE